MSNEHANRARMSIEEATVSTIWEIVGLWRHCNARASARTKTSTTSYEQIKNKILAKQK